MLRAGSTKSELKKRENSAPIRPAKTDIAGANQTVLLAAALPDVKYLRTGVQDFRYTSLPDGDLDEFMAATLSAARLVPRPDAVEDVELIHDQSGAFNRSVSWAMHGRPLSRCKFCRFCGWESQHAKAEDRSRAARGVPRRPADAPDALMPSDLVADMRRRARLAR